MRELKADTNAKDLWEAIKRKFRTTLVTKLRSLTIKFDSYKKHPNDDMKKHVRHMSNMINELADVGHELTNELQDQTVIRSLPYSWDHMRMTLTHNEYTKTFEDVRQHLELEEERQEAAKVMSANVHVPNPDLRNGSKRINRRNWKGKTRPTKKPKCDQQGDKKHGKIRI